MDKTELNVRLSFWRGALEKLRKAYLALVDGGVKAYRIDDRELTRLDLPALAEEIAQAEAKVDQLEALAAGMRPRKAFAVLPRDW